MQRQVWVFLTEADEEELVSRMAAQHPLRRLRGRFFRGSAADLRQRPEELETRQLRRGETWTHLIHPTASRELVATPVDDGPFAGWMRLDEVRSEVITIVRPAPELQGLGPARVQAATHAWFAGTRVRKSPDFSRWVSQTMQLAESYPTCGFDWMHVAPAARELALAGGTLHYLYRPVPLEPAPATEATRPHQGK